MEVCALPRPLVLSTTPCRLHYAGTLGSPFSPGHWLFTVEMAIPYLLEKVLVGSWPETRS